MSKAFLIFTLLCFGTVIYGQNVPETLLWKVTKSGTNNESFLFGTFHEVDPFFFDSLTNVLVKLQQSDVLFVEQRISAAKTANLIKQPQWSFKKWSSVLTNEQMKIFVEFVKKAEDSSYYNLNPLMLHLTASRLYLTNFCQVALTSTQLMDNHIEDIALNSGKQVFSLDINQERIFKKEVEKSSLQTDSLYASYSIHYMKSMLNNDLTDCKIIIDYKKFALDYKLDVAHNATDSWLLDERNTKWVGKLHKSLSKRNCFIAVGFRHLFYKQGLIQKLRSLGYDVTPIPIERLN